LKRCCTERKEVSIALSEQKGVNTPQWPAYVEYAFNARRVISAEEWVQEDIEAFQGRWGGVDLLRLESRGIQQWRS
jgi:hypothetical protein